MDNSTLVNAHDLALWAATIESRHTLPWLVRSLVYATVPQADLKTIDYPYAEGVQTPGWDGIVETTHGTSNVPTGTSCWELSNDAHVTSKANADYQKRTIEPVGVIPAETTFIFVTARSWRDKRKWITARQAEGLWRDVRAYDAADIGAWLEQASAVHVSLSILTGKRPSDVIDFATFWDEWAGVTNPTISPELAVAGRENVATEILKWSAGEASALTLQSDTRHEALAVALAGMKLQGRTVQESLFARGIVVEDRTAWRRLVASPNRMILVPMFDDRSRTASAVRAGHHVLIPADRSESKGTHTVAVPRVRFFAAETALANMGFQGRRLRELAVIARRSLPALRRSIAVSPTTLMPKWAFPTEARSIIPALLVGSWDEQFEADRKLVERIAKVPYDRLKQELIRWANEADPPVRYVGGKWYLVSVADAWSLLDRFVTDEDMAALHDATIDTLSEVDTAYDLPANQRFIGIFPGRPRIRSGLAAKGVAETLAFLTATDTVYENSRSHSSRHMVEDVVRQVLKRANGDWRLWATLTQLLPLLSEAAPNEFLNAVRAGLSGVDPVLKRLFPEPDANAMLFGAAPHYGLLWALEALAWSAEHLNDSALLLARLAAMGLPANSRTGSRPDASLRDIFLTWRPQTSVDLAGRLTVLDRIRHNEPDFAFQLLRQLLPESHSSVSSTYTPNWRDWVPDPLPNVMVAEVERAATAIAERMRQDAGTLPARWGVLIDEFPNLPAEEQSRAIVDLRNLVKQQVGQDGMLLIWSALRKLISRHREFEGVDWALAGERINELEQLYLLYEPDDIVDRYGWLYADYPPLLHPPVRNWQAREAMTNDAQVEAAHVIIVEGGIDLLKTAAMRVERPGYLGHSAKLAGLSDEDAHILLSSGLASDDQAIRMLCRGLVWAWQQAEGIDWALRTVDAGHSKNWTPVQRAEFYTCLPMTHAVVARVEREPAEVVTLYWKGVSVPRMVDDFDAEKATQKLLVHGRPLDAVFLCEYATSNPTNFVSANTICEALSQAANVPARLDVDYSMFAHVAAELINHLDKSTDTDQSTLATLEWMYLPLLHMRRSPKALHNELVRNPEFFSLVLAAMYRSKNDTCDVTEGDKSRARVCNDLMESWHGLPGLEQDGSFNYELLQDWIKTVHELSEVKGIDSVANRWIGHMLATPLRATDGTWPHPVVCQAIEDFWNSEIEAGFTMQVINSRGMTSRSMIEGGDSERNLMNWYLTNAMAIQISFPHTASLLRCIATSYEERGHHEDTSAELREDLTM